MRSLFSAVKHGSDRRNRGQMSGVSRTVNSQITERSTSCTLNFGVLAAEEE